MIICGGMGLWSWSSLDGWWVKGYSNVGSSRIGRRHLVGGNARRLTMIQDWGLDQTKGIEVNSVSGSDAPTETRCAKNWSPSSWRSKKALQQPDYKDKDLEEKTLSQLAKQSPLVFAGEVRHLHTELMRASEGERFVLMGGDCAESFEDFKVSVCGSAGRCPCVLLCKCCLKKCIAVPARSHHYHHNLVIFCSSAFVLHVGGLRQGYLQGRPPNGLGFDVRRWNTCDKNSSHGWAVCQA